MDQIADKFITTTAMILVLFEGVACKWLAIVMLLIVVLRDILIGGIRMVAANKNFVIAADIYGKIKSFFLDVASMVLMLYVGLTSAVGAEWVEYVRYAGLSLMIIGVGLTVISCVNYTTKAIKKLSESEEKVLEESPVDEDDE
jgi:CDP-diacylglycerol--glycerol-3-phosphate 3-phosphatidyltransferase